MMSRIPGVLEKVLTLSKADECIAIGWESGTANIRWANNTSTTNGVGSSSQLYVISILGKRLGIVGKTYFPDERLEEIVRESERACEGKPEAEDYMPLVKGDGLEGDWLGSSEATGIEVFSEFAPSLADLFARAEKSSLKLFGFAEHTTSTLFMATTTGLRRRHSQTEGKVEINAKSSDFGRSAWVGKVAKNFRDVDLEAIYERLEQRLDWSKKSISLEPGHYQVLMEPSAVADMLIYSYWTSSARDADEGRTVFSKPGGGNRIGEKLYSPGVEIYSNPSEPGMEVTPFSATTRSSSFASVFDNGLASEKVMWAKDGTLENLIVPRYWAEKSQVPAIPYINNLIMSGDGASFEEMIANSERTLLLTCLWYIREVDPQTLLLTGLTRDGVFLIENGSVKGAVNNFRYNMSPIAMLAQTVEIGDNELTLPREWGDYFTFAKVPPLRVDDFNMSSVSQAT